MTLFSVVAYIILLSRKSGELFMLYHDWKLHKTEEIIFNCNSGGIPHQHCMDIMIAERMK